MGSENGLSLHEIAAKLEAASAYLDGLLAEKGDGGDEEAKGLRSLITGSIKSDSSLEDEVTRRLLVEKVDGYKTSLIQALTRLDSAGSALRGRVRDADLSGSIGHGSWTIGQNRALITFDSLPNDVLSDIFRLAIFSCVCTESCAAIRLSGINKRSRDLILNTKSFWATLSTKVSFEVNFLSLQRSQKYLLTVHMRGRHSYFEGFLKRLSSVFHRFGSLRIYDKDSWEEFWKAYHTVKSKFKSLMQVDIRGVGLDGSEGYTNFCPFVTPLIKRYNGQWFAQGEDTLWTLNLIRCTFQIYPDFQNEYQPFFFLPSCETLVLQFLRGYDDLHRVSKAPINNEDSDYEEDENDEEDMDIEYVSSFHKSLKEDYIAKRPSSNVPELRSLDITMHNYKHIFFAGRTLQTLPLEQLTSLRIELHFKIYDSSFFDIFAIEQFAALKTFEIVFPRLLDNDRSIFLETMQNLEHLIIRGVSGFTVFGIYVQYIKELAKLRTILFDNCEVLESHLVDMAEALSDTSRYKNFTRLLLRRCPVQPRILRTLESVLHHKFKYET